ncbi:hypothetical protein ACUXAV_002152 [Cupriavidus metallidurans]|nr:hypothetical protein AU374_03584 [Cupriavidus metallidurans]
MAAFPGPTSEQYKKMSKTAKITYWLVILLVFTSIAYVWLFK